LGKFLALVLSVPDPEIRMLPLLIQALALLSPFQLARSAPGHAASHDVVDVHATAPLVFEGFVLEADGSPAVGAVVVSSAGGRAVTGPDGRYRLEARVPLDAHEVEITAAADEHRMERKRVELFAHSGVVPVDPLAVVSRPGRPSCWEPTFGGLPGMEGSVFALTTFDDGNGTALYAGGSFTTAGGVAVNHVARWNGSSWQRLGGGLRKSSTFDAVVWALAVFDDGSGPALYAAGSFATAGGTPANNVAKWDGSSWMALGSGVGGGLDPAVRAMAVFDDGSGPALYLGGTFTSAGGGTANRVAKWNGSSWSALGTGTNSDVRAMAVFDDGGGPALYAGGLFSKAGGITVNRIAKWNGSSWSTLGSGVNSHVRALTVFDDGGGPALYLGGAFTDAGGVPANSVAKWDGSSFAALGSGTDRPVAALTVFDDGGGPALFAGGEHSQAGGVFLQHVSKWDGSSWSALANGTSDTVHALAVFDDGSGPALYAGGDFKSASSPSTNQETQRIARWDGSKWSALGGARAPSDPVHALTVFDDGSGPALFAGGSFDLAGGTGVSRIARWNGSSWSALAFGLFLSGPSAEVRALAVFDDGSGPALYAGGSFGAAGFLQVNHVAKWDGSSWTALGSGVGGNVGASVEALAVFDDGSGPALYAGGSFTTAGGVPANHVAKWNGSSWSALSSGTNSDVVAFAVFDDGGGPALYAGGNFTIAGGFGMNHVAKWNGSIWTGLGVGANAAVSALSVFDDGGGKALYAGGDFTTAGGSPANHVAKWNGSSWTSLQSGTNGSVACMTAFDDGSGLALYVGGSFTSAGGMAANRIARWNSPSWESLDSGMSGTVAAMAVLGSGHGAALFAGGSFGSALDAGDSYLARWRCTGIGVQSAIRRR
jgi:hypothetical protein